MDEWGNKMWSIHIMEYYSAIKRNEVLIHIPMWMNFENFMLSERKKAQKGHVFHEPIYMEYIK